MTLEEIILEMQARVKDRLPMSFVAEDLATLYESLPQPIPVEPVAPEMELVEAARCWLERAIASDEHIPGIGPAATKHIDEALKG